MTMTTANASWNVVNPAVGGSSSSKNAAWSSIPTPQASVFDQTQPRKLSENNLMALLKSRKKQSPTLLSSSSSKLKRSGSKNNNLTPSLSSGALSLSIFSKSTSKTQASDAASATTGDSPDDLLDQAVAVGQKRPNPSGVQQQAGPAATIPVGSKLKKSSSSGKLKKSTSSGGKLKKSSSSGKLKRSGSDCSSVGDPPSPVISELTNVNDPEAILKAAAEAVKKGFASACERTSTSPTSITQQRSALLAKANPLSTDKLLQHSSKRVSTGCFRPSKASMTAKQMKMTNNDDHQNDNSPTYEEEGHATGNATFSAKKPRRKLRTETLKSLGLDFPSRSGGQPPSGLLVSGSLHRTPSKSCLKTSASSSGLRRASTVASMREIEITLPGDRKIKRMASITFNEQVEVKRVESSSNMVRDKKELWFQQDEMKEIRDTSKRLVDLLDKSVADPNLVDIRGLEEHRKEERQKSKERIYDGWDAVLDAQDDQRLSGEYCDEEIASMLRSVSRDSLHKAQRKAKKDAKDVSSYVSAC